MGSRDIDYVKAMSNVCQSGFSTKAGVKMYPRLVMGYFVLAVLLFSYSMITSQPVHKSRTRVNTSSSVKETPHQQHLQAELVIPESYKVITAETGKDLIRQLEKHNLWDNPLPSSVPAIILERYPKGLNQLTTDDKKKVFLHSLLPIALMALSEVADERRQLIEILEKYQKRPVRFESEEDGKKSAWMKQLSAREKRFMLALTKKYRTTLTTGLLSRVNTVPVSLILAQGAIESSWGSSRFAHKGNNLFGIWTWGEKGMVPQKREEGKNHLVATYDSLLDSVRAYVLMLNRLNAYKQLRTIRKRSNDPVALAAGLLNYSERGGVYVSDIGRIIDYNNLRDFDSYTVVDASVKAAKTETNTAQNQIASGTGKLFSN